MNLLWTGPVSSPRPGRWLAELGHRTLESSPPPPATSLSPQGSQPRCPLRGICPVVHSGCPTFCLISSIQLFNRSIKEAAVAVETKWMAAGRTVGLGCLPADAPQSRSGKGSLKEPPSILPEGVQKMTSTVPVLTVTYTLVS